MLTDEIILQNFIKNGKVISAKVSKSWLNIHKDFKQYKHIGNDLIKRNAMKKKLIIQIIDIMIHSHILKPYIE